MDFLEFFDDEPVQFGTQTDHLTSEEPTGEAPVEYLSFFDEDEPVGEDPGQQNLQVCEQMVDSVPQILADGQRPSQSQIRIPNPSGKPLFRISGPSSKTRKTKVRKAFYFSKGTVADRKAWNLDMQLRKSIARQSKSQSDILDLLTRLRVKSKSAAVQIKRTKKGQLFTKSGLVRAAFLKVKTKGNRFELKCSLQDFLTASFGEDEARGKRIEGRNAQALSLKLAPSTISYMRTVTCGAVLARQANLLARIFLLCKSCAPVAAGLREAFDETQQKLVVKRHPGEFQVMVIKHTLLIFWESRSIKIPIVCPSVIVLSPSAECIHYALANHPSLQTIFKLERLILSTAGEKLVLQETDSASANERLYNYRLHVGKSDKILRELIVCHNHQNNLAEGSLVATAHPSLISDFFSFSHFLKASSHFAKLKLALRDFIVRHATITTSVVEWSWEANGCSLYKRFVDELLDMHARIQFSLGILNRNTSLTDALEQNFRITSSALEKKIKSFQRMWNQDGFCHVCERFGPQSTWCCQDDREAKQKLADTLLNLAVSSIPDTPAPGKWTKLWSCLEFTTFGYLFNSWICKVLPTWLDSLKFSGADTWTSAASAHVDDVDPALKSTQEFSRITGVRAKKAKQFVVSLESGDLGLNLTALSIADEVLRFLTFHFMSINDVASTKPNLINLINEDRSPLIACTQYLTSLLFQEYGRTMLLWKKQGFVTAQQWEFSAPQQVRSFRRLVLLTCAWIQRRHCDRLLIFPFSLTLLADENTSESKKTELLRLWDATLPCCVRPGMARELKARGLVGQDLISPKRLCFCIGILSIW